MNRQNDIVGCIYDSIEKRVDLSATNLPSIAMHTFLNTGHSLNVVTITKDASVIAAGFSDALIRVYIQDQCLAVDISSGLEYRVREDEKTVSSERKMPVIFGKRKESILIGHSMGITCLSFSPIRYFLLSGSLDCTIRLWSIHTNSTLMIFKEHGFPIWDIKFAPFGYYFASASEDKTAFVWRTCNSYPIRSLVGHLSDVEVIEFHPNMHYVATGSSDKTIRLYLWSNTIDGK